MYTVAVDGSSSVFLRQLCIVFKEVSLTTLGGWSYFSIIHRWLEITYFTIESLHSNRLTLTSVKVFM